MAHQYATFRATLFIVLMLFIATAHAQKSDNPAQGQGQANNPNQAILDRLDAIQDQLATLEAKLDDLAGPQLSATFCISQGRGFALGADYIYQLDIETEAGLGWAEVVSAEATAEAKFPAFPIPSETAAKAEASHGRGFDICIELPLEMGPTDTALIAELGADINARADDFPNRGKFQRRAHRLLNYTKRRVPGIQTRTSNDFQPATLQLAMQEDSEAPADEFDRIDNAIEQLLDAGLLRSNSNALGMLQNPDVRELVSAFEDMPVDARQLIDRPQDFFGLIDDIGGNGIDNLPCARFRLDAALRSDHPGLDRLCDRLESLPDFATVEQILSGELIADLFDALDTLTITSSASQVSSTTRSRFCNTAIGSRPRYDNFCGR